MEARTQRFSMAAVVIVVVVGGLRVAARTVFRPHEESHQSAKSCGALTWRTTTVTRKSRFEPDPVVVREESIVELEGRAVITDVAHFSCSLGGPVMHFRAAVVRRADGERANVSVFDAGGSLVRVVHFDHDVESTSWSHESEYFAALGPKGEVSVADVEGARDPVVLSRDKALLGGRVTWSHDGKTACFVTGKPPTADDGSAELWCSAVPTAPVSIAKATWTGLGTLAPWVGFAPRGGKPHLCGDDLKPRDVDCLAMSRPTE